MNTQSMWIFIIVLVGGVFYIALVEGGILGHVLEYMSAISLAFIAITLMHIATKMKNK